MMKKTLLIAICALCFFAAGPAFCQDDNSPFGIMAAFDLSTLQYISVSDKQVWAGEKFRDLGAKWSRSNGDNIFWFEEEPVLGGGYNWSKIDAAMDKIYNNGGDGFNTVVIVSPARGNHQNPLPIDILPENEVYFTNFVKAMVERYDGDGIDDYNSDIKVKYWQAFNEPFPSSWEKGNGGTKAGFARFVKLLHDGAEAADPESKIVLGAASTRDQDAIDIFEEVVLALKTEGAKFDAADTHFWKHEDNYKVPIEEMRGILNENGYTDVKIFSLEHGTTVGSPTDPINWPIQTEIGQAKFLIKSYAYNITNGVSLINWNNLVEWDAFGGDSGNIYNYQGLIADGQNGDPVPAGTPRLSYYTYKKMTEKLEGSDWDNIQTIQESGGIYIYKFNKNGRSVWVAWNDNVNSQLASLDVGNINSVKITEAIPNKELGKDVDYENDFTAEIKFASSGFVSIDLGDKPVFIEKIPNIVPGDLNADGAVSIADIQLCIKVILNQLDPEEDAAIIQRAKEAALPYETATIKDIQEIIRIISGG